MFSTGLVLLSDQMALQRAVDVIANNIANSSTTGFKREGIQFDTYLSRPTPKQKTAFVYDRATYQDTSPGTISMTGNPFDLAIQGEGYFQIQTPQGIQYTRDGAFRTNEQGQIVTSSGYPVLSDGNQPITVPEDAYDFTISADGFITAQSGTGSSRAQLGKLGMVKFEHPEALVPTSNGLLATEQEAQAIERKRMQSGTRPAQQSQMSAAAASAPQPGADGQIVQGAIETSNVKPVLEITTLIKIQRAYEQASNMVGQENSRLTDAIDKLSQTTS